MEKKYLESGLYLWDTVDLRLVRKNETVTKLVSKEKTTPVPKPVPIANVDLVVGMSYQQKSFQ